MERIFIKNIEINKVRHLKNINIPVFGNECRHIIFTGKNGSGKTSVLDAMAVFINSFMIGKNPAAFASGVSLEFNTSLIEVRKRFEAGKFVVAYYKANRIFSSFEPKYVEKVQLKSDYAIDDTPRSEFIKYLLDLKMTQALAISSDKIDKANTIAVWFEKFNCLLKQIFEDESVELVFDEDTFKFSIIMDGREPFDFNTLSSGYAAILDIVVDLIIRMEKQLNRTFDFSIPGVVLIDEIETHLHLELQKNIMSLLTTIFPTVQFIVSSHSPFVLNSLDNVVIYDLEKKVLVENQKEYIKYLYQLCN